MPTIQHPVWCSPEYCTLEENPDGTHESAPLVIDSRSGIEPISGRVFLSQSASGNGHTLLMLELGHDPDICGALEMSDEPDVYVFSLAQGHQLRSAIDRLLNLTTDRHFTP